MKRFALILAVMILLGCAPSVDLIATAVPATPVAPTEPVVPTLPPTPLPTEIPTQEPTTPPAVAPIRADTLGGLTSTAFSQPASVWKLLWPAPDHLLVLGQPENNRADAFELSLHPAAEVPAGQRMLPDGLILPDQRVEFSVDASRLAYLDGGGQLHLAALSGEQLAVLPTDDPIYGFAFSADGGRLVTTSPEKWEATLWSVDGNFIARMDDFETAAPIYAAYAGFDSSLVWIARATAQVDDIQSGQTRFSLHYTDFITDFAFSADGTSLALAVEGRVRLVDLQNGSERWSADAPGVYSIALSPDGLLLAGASNAGVRVWDAGSGVLLAELAGDVTDVSFSLDGSVLVGVLNGGGLVVWE